MIGSDDLSRLYEYIDALIVKLLISADEMSSVGDRGKDDESDEVLLECGECGGDGCISDGGCGGGCEFCQPFPMCNACNGTGQVWGYAEPVEDAVDLFCGISAQER